MHQKKQLHFYEDQNKKKKKRRRKTSKKNKKYPEQKFSPFFIYLFDYFAVIVWNN